MQKYQDVVLSQNGNPVQGAQITVTNLSGTPVPAYGSDVVGVDVNPVQSDVNGRFFFYAPDGRYNLVVRLGGTIVATITDILLEDPSDASITGGTINATSIGATTPSTGAFTTLSTTGNVTLGDASTDTVTVNGYMGVGGAANPSHAITILSNALTGASQRALSMAPVYTSAATANGTTLASIPSTAAASFTMTALQGFRAFDATKGAGSTITNQHGVQIDDQTQGTNNYGITSSVSSGANKWNIYASGTAANYFAGNVGIGVTAANLAAVSRGLTIGSTTSGEQGSLEIQGSRTATDQTVGALRYYQDTNQIASIAGIRGAATNTGYLSFFTNNAGSLTERLRIDSAGFVGVNTTSPTVRAEIVDTSSGAEIDVLHVRNNATATSTASTIKFVNSTAGGSNSGSVELTAIRTGTNTGDFVVRTSDSAASMQERLRIDSSGNVLVTNNTGGLGYGTGAGGTVTQATSRTTAVTLNRPTGQITMFSAAGSTSPASFVVNNSLVTASDTVVLSMRSGNSNVYNYQVNGMGAGTFGITFWTTGGTAVDAPIISFAIIKGSAA